MVRPTRGSLLLALFGLILLAPAGFFFFAAYSEGAWIGLIPLFMLLASAVAGLTCLFLAVRGIER